jgi:exodeoxyribonuclease VII large subunit
LEPLDLFSRRQVLSVRELVSQLKKLVEKHYDFVWVEGEVSGLRRPGSGHLYFSLKDPDANMKAVLFRHQAAMLRFALEDGLKVLCQGRVSVYGPRGDLQLVVDTVEPQGAGALALAFEQIKKRLEAEGLFAAERKQPLPDLPKRIAVVTSPTGAAIRDFLNVLHRRFAGVEVAIYPVLVQGDEAPRQMIQALSDLSEWAWPEVIVLTRGGGSPEDLWAFNDEGLARAIAECPIPVVSAVGHEIDVSISDLVADLRASTPSAAAELLVKPQAELAGRLAGLNARLLQSGARLIARRRSELNALSRGLIDPRRRLADKRLRVDDLLSRAASALRAGLHEKARDLWGGRERLLAQRPDRRLALAGARLAELTHRLGGAGVGAITGRRAKLDQLNGRLRALSPLAVLGRGYALALGPDAKVLSNAAQVKKGDDIKVRLAKGTVHARVREVEA